MYERNLYEMPQRQPLTNGVLDRRLGTSDKKGECATCHGKLQECAGHFGTSLRPSPSWRKPQPSERGLLPRTRWQREEPSAQSKAAPSVHVDPPTVPSPNLADKRSRNAVGGDIVLWHCGFSSMYGDGKDTWSSYPR